MASKLGVTALYVTPTQESGGSFDPRTRQDRRHCLGHWDNAASTSSKFFLVYLELYKVRQRSHVSNTFRILRTTVFKISLFFLFYLQKNAKAIGFWKTVYMYCMSFICVWVVWLQSFSCRFVSILARPKSRSHIRCAACWCAALAKHTKRFYRRRAVT